MNSKERSKLKALASTMQPIMQVGKYGISEALLKSLSDALEARELVKITVLDTAEDTPLDTAEFIAEELGAEVVIVMGKKAVLYRPSSRDGFAHLL